MSAPKLFRVKSEADLDRIPFENGMAAVEVPSDLLDKIELRDFDRGDSARLLEIERSIRAYGYQPISPIQVRIGRKGRWVVVDGGHRLTALRKIAKEFWSNLFRRKVDNVYFVLFLTPDSWARTEQPAGVELPKAHAEDLEQVQESWDRASKRAKAIEDVT